MSQTEPTSTSTDTPAVSSCLFLLWGVTGITLVADQLTKVWAVQALGNGRQIDLLGSFLSLNLVRNPGAAFSFATGSTWIFTIVAIAIAIVIVRASKQLAYRPWAVTLGLILGGALGNLADRLFRSPGFARGHVVDFINYAGKFVGNVADIAIVVAAVAVVVLSLIGVGLDGQRTASNQPAKGDN